VRPSKRIFSSQPVPSVLGISALFRFGHMRAYDLTSPGNCRKTPPQIEELVTSLDDHRESRVTVDGQGGWHVRHGVQAANLDLTGLPQIAEIAGDRPSMERVS
jgi:hypothetical protein